MYCRTKPENKAKEYVIPLIKRNKWRQGEGDGVESQAVQELLDGKIISVIL